MFNNKIYYGDSGYGTITEIDTSGQNPIVVKRNVEGIGKLFIVDPSTNQGILLL